MRPVEQLGFLCASDETTVTPQRWTDNVRHCNEGLGFRRRENGKFGLLGVQLRALRLALGYLTTASVQTLHYTNISISLWCPWNVVIQLQNETVIYIWQLAFWKRVLSSLSERVDVSAAEQGLRRNRLSAHWRGNILLCIPQHLYSLWSMTPTTVSYNLPGTNVWQINRWHPLSSTAHMCSVTTEKTNQTFLIIITNSRVTLITVSGHSANKKST